LGQFSGAISGSFDFSRSSWKSKSKFGHCDELCKGQAGQYVGAHGLRVARRGSAASLSKRKSGVAQARWFFAKGLYRTEPEGLRPSALFYANARGSV